MRLISTISATLLALIIPLGATAQSGECGDNATWTLDGNTLTISGTGTLTNYISPNSIYATFPGWYEYKDEIKKVVITDGITNVGDYSFYQYKFLESVSLPEGITKIGNYTFAECWSLSSINIPSTVEIIGDAQANYCKYGFSFRDCRSLTEITLPKNLKLIGGEAFSNCTQLTTVNWNATDCVADVIDPVNRFCGIFAGSGVFTVNFGPDVKAVPAQAFRGAEGLTNVNTKGSIDYVGHSAFLGTVWQNSRKINELIYVDNAAYLFKYSAWIPEDDFGPAPEEITLRDGTRGITDYLFENKTFFKKITIPETVDRIGNHAFSGCTALETVVWNPVEIQDIKNYNASKLFGPTLRKIEFGNKVTMLPANFLDGCTGLTELNLPASLKIISTEAISHCDGLTELVLPDAVETLGRLAIDNCPAIEKLTVGKGLKTFDYYYFLNGCSALKTLEWNAVATEEKKFDAYHGSDRCAAPVETLVFGDAVEYVPGQLFWNASKLTDVTFGSSVKKIGDAAFRGCANLTAVTLPESLESIGEYAFYKTSVSSFILPENVTEIKAWALGTRTLADVIAIPLEAPRQTSIFVDAPKGFIAYVPDEASYKSSTWSSYTPNIKAMATPVKSSFTESEIAEGGITFTCNIPECEITGVDTSALETTKGEHTGLVGLTFAGRYNFIAKVPFSYTVTENSAVTDITAATDTVDVYTLDGICVLKAATRQAVDALPAGIYIVRRDTSVEKVRI